MILGLSEEIVDSNLEYFGKAVDSEPLYMKIRDSDLTPIDLVNLAFPRFVSKQRSLDFLLDENIEYFSLEDRSMCLEVTLSLLDGFKVIKPCEVILFDELFQTSLDFYKLPWEVLEDKSVSDLQFRVLDSMRNLAYLSGDINSCEFGINLRYLDNQLGEQKEIMSELIDIPCENLIKMSEYVTENVLVLVDTYQPSYLPILKEKAKRVGGFLVDCDWKGRLD